MTGVVMWSEDYMKYDFGNDHPYKTEKFELFIERVKTLKAEGVIKIEINEPGPPIDSSELKIYNNPEFIDHLLHLEKTGGMIDPGTPSFPNMVEISSIIVHGTYIQIRNIIKGRYQWAFNAVGGYHHGKPNSSAGGCVLNDIGIGIGKLRKEGIDQKIAIIDIDYHPHDGTVEFFLNDNQTMCLSIHEKGWFDFDEDLSKYYTNIVNVPIKSTQILTDQEYLEIFKEKIITKVRDFNPDLILLVHGVDGHENDSVTYYGMKEKSIALSTPTYGEIDGMLCVLAKEICDGRIMGLGAGGYSVSDTVDVWVQAVKIFNEHFENRS